MTKFGDRSSFKPSKIRDVPPGKSFVQHWVKLIESKAMRSLSRYGFLMLLRLEAEHCHHAAKENGYLAVRYNEFVKWGIPRKAIKSTIIELANAKLLVVEHQGRGHKGDGSPSLYRLTYLKSKFVPVAGSPTYMEPTNDWQKLETNKPNQGNGAGFPGSEPRKISFQGSYSGNPAGSPVGTQQSDRLPDSAIPQGSPRGNYLSTLRATKTAPRPCPHSR